MSKSKKKPASQGKKAPAAARFAVGAQVRVKPGTSETERRLMRWRRNRSERSPRPRARKLPPDEQQQLLTQMTEEIARSPVLSAFGVQVRFLRGRFYVERPTAGGSLVWGRITPVDGDLLLEVERRSWKAVVSGTAEKLIKAIASDTRGTFHGLGSLDQSLRRAGQGLTRQPLKFDSGRFVYADTDEGCSVQEALFHCFGLPVQVIAQPALWYSYHRTPHLMEFSEDHSRVLVRFSAVSGSGEPFGGTCLYALREGQWGAYPIKPSESRNIATAEAWLVKRKWKAW
jgi:hypothetical protein